MSHFADHRFAELLGRILRHPELELRVFLEPRELDGVIEGVMHVLCFENGAESSLVTPVGPSWVVLDRALAVFGDLDWFRTIFDPNLKDRHLAYPRAGFEGRYSVLSREDVARMAVELQPLLDDPIPSEITARLKMLVAQAGTPAPIIEKLNKALRAAPTYPEVTDRITADGDFNLPVMALSQELRAAAEGLARLAAKALSREELTLAHTSLL
jgi:hypothetical protein